MKKIRMLFSLLFAFIAIFACGGSFNNKENTISVNSPKLLEQETEEHNPITYRAFKSNLLSVFGENAEEVNINLSKVLTVEVVNSGEIRRIDETDTKSEYVFSDFVHLNFKINLKTTRSDRRRYVTKLLGYRVNENTSYYTKLEHRVNHGVFIQTKYEGDENVELYSPIYMDNGRALNNIVFTGNGDYKMFFLFQNGNDAYVIYMNIPVRARCYVTNEEKNLQLRPYGTFYDSVLLDVADVNSKIYVDGVEYNHQPLTEKREYVITVRSSRWGILCDKFKFIVSSTEQLTPLIYLHNFKQQISDDFYEVEGSLKLTYQENINDIKYSVNYVKVDDEASLENVQIYNNEIKSIGVYSLWLVAEKAGEVVDTSNPILVFVNDYDSPSFNKNFLSSNRFNNFITKWLEIYDEENDEYYCFSVNSYNNAKKIALSIENSKVLRLNGSIYYSGKQYNDEVALTYDLDKNAEKNIVVKYYDPYDSKHEKNFNSDLFDGTRYLNQDFTFVQTNRCETNSVELISGTNYYNLGFSKKISEYNILDGEYTVKETDLFGNVVTYDAIVDLTTPKVILETNEGQIEGSQNQTYNANYFRIKDFFDEHDEYAVLKINDDYYIKDEYKDVIYFEQGIYYVKAYDRNNNLLAFNVVIKDHPSLEYHVENDVIKFDVPQDIEITKWQVNDVDVASATEIVLDENNQHLYIEFTYNSQKYVYSKDFLKENIVEHTYDGNTNIKTYKNGYIENRNVIILITFIVCSLFVVGGIIVLIYQLKHKEEHDS